MRQTIDPHLTEAQQAALELLRSAKSVLLTGHVRPDGDCIGAQAALARILTALGKDVVILNPDPPEPQFDYLSSQLDYRAYTGGAVPEHDLTVLLDCSELSRCGDLAPALAAAPTKKLVVDHHIHVGDEWWDETFADVTASATGVLVYRIARALEIELDTVAASGVFTSIVTDTGWFKYSNTDAETLRVAGELVEHGVDPSRVYGAIYQRRPAEHPTRVGQALASAEVHSEGRLAVVIVRLEEGRPADFDSDDVMDILRSVDGLEVVLLLRELEGGICKLSARSKTDYDVNALARQFGGGGHAKASGATLKGLPDDVMRELVTAAQAGFKESQDT